VNTNARVLVTGASGFIGGALVAALSRHQRPVTAVGRQVFDAPAGVTVVIDGPQTQAALAQCDCVVHLAARAHRGGTLADFEPDIALASRWARMSAQAGVRRFVQVSSIGVLGTRSDGAALTEDTLPAPSEPYAIAKLAAEDAVRRELDGSATEWVIVRPTMVYGPRAPGNFARLVRAVARGWPLPLASVRNRRHLVALDNLVDALLHCIDHDAAARQTFLIADDEAVSTPELVKLIAQGLHMPARLVKFPPALLELAARATGRSRIADSLLHDLVIDTGKSRRMLGWQPVVSPRDAIVRAAAAWRT
jgi:nucleoside-diphosphate-sugar epimerase